ncbi:MAG: class B sortase [Lachnospiraceae bacterium]
MKQNEKKKIYLALAVATVICIAFLAVFGTRKGEINDDEVEQLPEAPQEITIPEDSPLGKAKAENIDAIAWLQIPNTEIDNVVMQSSNNEYYLSHNEKRQKTPWGSYFADYYADLSSADSLIQNTVIYGHTENKDNPNEQRFSQLFKYTDLNFIKANRNIYLTVGASKLTFEVFAVFYSDTDFYYIDPKPSDQGFDKFMQEVNARNEFVFDGVEVTEQDKLLTLSGCSHKYDVNRTRKHRIVVMAKLVDDSAAPVGAITQNLNPKHPQ